MNLHQFRFVREAVRQNFNLTEAAKALFTSQPGVSKAILELEEELGIDLFVRHGKRLRRVTEPGQQVLKAIDVILRSVIFTDAFERLHFLQYFFHRGEDDPPRLGERAHALAVAREDFDAQLVLQLDDRLGNARLRRK